MAETVHFVNDYKIGEGNMIGTLPTEFGANLNLIEKALTAGADLTKGQVVELSGNLTVSPTSATSAKVIGVAMFDAKSGEKCTVECEGLFKLKAKGSISGGDKVESALAGAVAKIATTGTVNPIGIALNDATDGAYVYVKFSI